MILAALLLAAVCTPLATYSPTPTITWDHVVHDDLAGYSIWYNEPGGVPQKIRDIPCVWLDLSDPPDGIKEYRFCRGPDGFEALQRERDWTPLTAYEIRVKTYDAAGNVSTDFSNVLSVCFSKLCTPATKPCN